MTQSYKILGQAAPNNNTNTTLYTVPSGYSAVISSIIAKTGDADGQVTIWAIKSGESAGQANRIYDFYHAIGSNSFYRTYSFSDGITLAAGDSIVINGNTSGEGSQAFSVFGCEMSV